MKDTHSFLGFTLAELLAVIIIIAILSGLGIGYYKSSVEQSRFSEGLSAVGAVVEGINRTYVAEQLEGNPLNGVHSFATLDVGVGTACSSGNCRATEHFKIYIEGEGANSEVVRAYRGDKTNAIYYIEASPEHAANRGQIACGGNVSFCESMGYVNCSGSRCTKN